MLSEIITRLLFLSWKSEPSKCPNLFVISIVRKRKKQEGGRNGRIEEVLVGTTYIMSKRFHYLVIDPMSEIVSIMRRHSLVCLKQHCLMPRAL